MKTRIFVVFVFGLLSVYGQDRALIMHDAVVLNIDGGAALIVDQTNQNGITLSGTQNGIIHSEGELNRVAWIIRTATGTYNIPFGISTTVRFPFTYQVTAAGTGNGALIVSTYGTGWTNLPLPTVPPAVTNTGAQYIGGVFVERRQYVLDRYWILRDTDMPWTTKPTSTLTFRYRDIEHTQGSNTITEANLGAQYWDGTQWRPGWFSGSPPLGTVNTATNTVSGVNSGLSGNLFTWVLVDRSNPLPVELLFFRAICDDKGTVIEWMTASESNNSHFILEQSIDGMTWNVLTTITGAGNSNENLYYSYHINHTNNSYYRLTQVDYDGTENFLGIIQSNCASQLHQSPYANLNVYADDNNNIYVTFQSSLQDKCIIQLYDVNGKLIGVWQWDAVEGYNRFVLPVQPVRFAIYFVNVLISNKSETRKIVLK